ncbi:unnamed protein product [Prorocentrum cordatum]|uniref:Uncharacterized protein n=1 Tax=Prorocentrum cordatum TaxID=2364126 RepID=A0ABN9SRV1_9DINO|nr:unnamed protein product [Polarella glacialis]
MMLGNNVPASKGAKCALQLEQTLVLGKGHYTYHDSEFRTQKQDSAPRRHFRIPNLQRRSPAQRPRFGGREGEGPTRGGGRPALPRAGRGSDRGGRAGPGGETSSWHRAFAQGLGAEGGGGPRPQRGGPAASSAPARAAAGSAGEFLAGGQWAERGGGGGGEKCDVGGQGTARRRPAAARRRRPVSTPGSLGRASVHGRRGREEQRLSGRPGQGGRSDAAGKLPHRRT